jgi:hypothetical protein
MSSDKKPSAGWIKDGDVMSQLASFRGDDETNTHPNSPEPIAVDLTKLASSSSIGRTKLAELARGDCINIVSSSIWAALRGGTTSASWHGMYFRLWL